MGRSFDQTVNQAGTTTTMTSNVDPSVYGQDVSFTATVGARDRDGQIVVNQAQLTSAELPQAQPSGPAAAAVPSEEVPAPTGPGQPGKKD